MVYRRLRNHQWVHFYERSEHGFDFRLNQLKVNAFSWKMDLNSSSAATWRTSVRRLAQTGKQKSRNRTNARSAKWQKRIASFCRANTTSVVWNVPKWTRSRTVRCVARLWTISWKSLRFEEELESSRKERAEQQETHWNDLMFFSMNFIYLFNLILFDFFWKFLICWFNSTVLNFVLIMNAKWFYDFWRWIVSLRSTLVHWSSIRLNLSQKNRFQLRKNGQKFVFLDALLALKITKTLFHWLIKVWLLRGDRAYDPQPSFSLWRL